MRERSTWNRNAIKASLNKKADPFSMNQDHKQPATDAYKSGDPSSWAEDVHSPNEWEKDYSNGQTKRDEIGMPEKRKEAADTDLLLKKADLCVSVAKLMLNKTASEAVVEDQALALMSLPDQQLIETFNRLANEDEAAQEQEPAAEEPKQAQQDQAPAQQQEAPAEQAMTAAEQCMTAFAQGDMEGMKAALQQMVQEAVAGQQQAPAQQAPMQAQASTKKAQDDQGQQAPAQEEQKEASPAPVAGQDLQAMINAAVQAALAAQQGQQAPAEEPQAPMANQEEDLLLDDMLAPQEQEMMASGIELDPTPMDLGDASFGPEDAALKQLFATEEAPVQAAPRTAATRTVGTKPSAGVSKVGGAPAPQTKTAGETEANNLSSLWATAPDVREHFGMK